MDYVRVAVNVPAVTGEFDYHLPDALAGQVGVGHLVRVPFGAQTVQGVVLERISQPQVPETKAVIDPVDPDPVLTAAQVAFARQLADETLNPLAALVGLMLPPGLSQQADVCYALHPHWQDSDFSAFSPVQKRILELLHKRGPLRGRQLDRHFAHIDWRKSAGSLMRQAVLSSRSVLPPATARPKFIRTAQLAAPPAVVAAALPDLGQTAATLERRQKALRLLVHEPEALNVAWVYAESGCNLSDLQILAERGLIVLQETEIFRDPTRRAAQELAEAQHLPAEITLTEAQDSALIEILAAFEHPAGGASFLLHGVTGSGKTELYLRATAEALRRGRGVLILVPEIALTPQTVRRFLAHFPGQVGLLHSKLSDGERYDTWRRARAGDLKVIIGARSALFAPLPDVGLIVVDECHDHSYYQSEPPFYHAVSAAQRYARISAAVCILGSATPPVTLKYQAGSLLSVGEESGMRALSLPERLTPLAAGGVSVGTTLPPVSVVDMREELKSGNRGIFSRPLAESLAETFERGEQAILYLNRRGTATYVFCRDCGYVARCPNCETPLTQHLDGRGDLRCHHCGYVRRMLPACPQCGGKQIRAYGLGSEKVEAEVRAAFPSARTLRWDWETTREKDAHELILTHFANHQADVLIGTQMLAKGLDLPLVTLVGIVLAEVGLNLPDPFAGERTFQLLTQVAGRTGRSARGGKVVLQTFQPEHPVIQAAAQHDYAGFYAREIRARRALGYPPFGQLVRLEVRDADAGEVERAARGLAEKLKERIQAEGRRETELIGPVPCYLSKIGGIYRWQVILRGPRPAALLRGRLLSNCRIEVEPVSLL